MGGFTLEDLYEPVGLELGKGTFGSVRQYRHKFPRDGRNAHLWHTVAVKKTAPTILDKAAGRLRTYGDMEARCQEIKTLLRLRSTNPSFSKVLHLYEFFWNYNPAGGSELYMVTDLLGEELDQWRQRQRVFMESTARTIAKVLLDTIDFMHSRQVVHRDIKLQNVLFGKNEDFSTLKIVDFGLAKCLDGDRKVKDFCGSLGYMAPEIYNGEMYGYEVDMFAFGVILFRLLSGQRPFSSQNQEKLRRDTIDLQYSVDGNAWANISMDAQSLVRKLLIGCQERLTAIEALDHPWFRTQSESILRPDFTQNQDYDEGNDSYSQAIALVRTTKTDDVWIRLTSN
jgi:serine/threonine protein kinase